VELVDGKWRCKLCDAELDARSDKGYKTMIIGTPGKANARGLRVGGREIHRCDADLDRWSITAD
jgi:hypothetical protein